MWSYASHAHWRSYVCVCIMSENILTRISESINGFVMLHVWTRLNFFGKKMAFEYLDLPILIPTTWALPLQRIQVEPPSNPQNLQVSSWVAKSSAADGRSPPQPTVIAIDADWCLHLEKNVSSESRNYHQLMLILFLRAFDVYFKRYFEDLTSLSHPRRTVEPI